MMRQYELVERVLRYDPSADEALLNKAYVYAMKAHGAQIRASGEPYFSHPLEVAAILADLKLDHATVVTALLHDVIEDTEATQAEIDQVFGPEIGSLVDGLTKIKRLDLVSKRAEQAENFRKLLVAISSDIRVLLVKLADRLHNMRTLEHMKPESRKRSSEETLDIYAPLAGRIGMQAMREELEELAFRWLYPEPYEALAKKLSEIRGENTGLVDEISVVLKEKLAQTGIVAEVTGREKKPYAIWQKMRKKQISLEQLSDIYAFRVTATETVDCYRVLGLAHTTWRTVPGRFKDYISTPKQNNYQSIHTTIVGPRHQRVELQIRTRLMHRVAEYGVAAHALYKEAKNPNGVSVEAGQQEFSPYVALRHMVESLLEGSNPEEFLEHTKLELFQDQVFCFTPKGLLIALPHGATPLDFAYAVHTDVGNSAVGAYVNGRHVPIDTKLRNGDEVEIETSKTHTPPISWEGFAATGRARAAIRRASRDAVRRQFAELGRRLVAQKFASLGEVYGDEKVKRALPRLSQRTIDDALAAVARGELVLDDLIKAALPHVKLEIPLPVFRPKNRWDRGMDEDGWFNLGTANASGLKFRDAANETGNYSARTPIRVWRNDVPITFEEGGALPGDRIVGVLSPGEGIRIFQIHSPKLQEVEHQRWIDVAWDLDPQNPARFPASLDVTALNEPGSLAQIAQVIGEADGNIDSVKMTRRAADFTEIRIDLEVWDLDHLRLIMTGLEGKTVVARVDRVLA